VAVPSTLLNARRAYVPGTVSFTEMRSQAPREDELERPRGIRLDVVASKAVAVARRPVRAGNGREAERVAGLLHEAHVLGAVVGERALHEGVGVDAAAQTLLETELRERDLARRRRGLELGHGPVPDPVRLDADAAGLERRELVPADRLVVDAERAERLLVRKRTVAVEEADRDEDHRRVAVALEDRQRVLEVVAVPVVEGDENRAFRKRGRLDVVGAHLLERDGLVPELGEQRHLLGEDARGTVVGFGCRSFTLWYMRTRSVRSSAPSSAPAPVIVSPIARYTPFFRSCFARSARIAGV
jgi:hypothetical protein